VRQAVQAARGGFVMPALAPSLSQAEQRQARAIVADSLRGTVDLALWIAAALTLVSALVAGVSLQGREKPAARR